MGFLKKFTKQEISWMMYDWANSAHSVIVVTILPIFFDTVAGYTADSVSSMSTWGFATSLAMAIVALSAPFLGVFGDIRGMRKKLFTVFMLLGVVSVAGLAFTPLMDFTASTAAAGRVAAMVLVLYILSTIGFDASCIYYDAFLTDVTTEERMDSVSTLGYGFGYIGGSTIPLVLSLLLIQLGDAIGIGTMLATRISFLLTAGWWLVFTLPMLRHVHQKHGIDPERNIVLHTLRNVKDTCCMILKNKSVVFFIIAYFFYIDGVGTIIHMATVFGDSCGLGSMDMMVVLLVVQIVAFPFAILYGKLAERFGSRTMILTGIATYIVVCFVAFRLSTLRDFLILAVLVGTAQGGIQALSRSFFGKLVPQESASEYFGFFDVFGKFSAVIGPTLFGIVAQATGVSRYGILPVLGMFILGGVIMAFVVPKNIQRIH